MKRLMGAVTVLALLIALLPGTAGASCIRTTPEQQASSAAAIVYGKIARLEQPPGGGTYTIVTVLTTFKGNPSNPLLIYSQSGAGMATSVDYNMAAGEEHTLYLMPGQDATYYSVNACTGSHPGQPTAEELKVLGAGKAAPPPGQPPRIPGDPGASAPVRILIPWIAMGVAFTAILAALFVPRLLRRKGR